MNNTIMSRISNKKVLLSSIPKKSIWFINCLFYW